MMINSVQTSIVFYFKGERFNPQIELNLNTYFQKDYDITNIYDLLAHDIGLDSYRHEYDVMVMEKITYSAPKGIAEDHVVDGDIDWISLEAAYHRAREYQAVQALAQVHFSEAELGANPKLMAAMMDVYQKTKKA